MRPFLFSCALVLAAFPGARAQGLTPTQALDRYLDASGDAACACAGRSFTVQIDASLPKLKKRGSARGIKLLSETGHTVYRGLQFTGDKTVKNDVIARFLSQDAELQEHRNDAGVNRNNYSFTYFQTSDYNGMPAFVYRLKPLRKRQGMFIGELWLEAASAAPLRLWGDFVKSPSIFIRSFRFVEDYQRRDDCLQPVRLLVSADTRIAGPMEMSERLQFVDLQPAAAGDQLP